MKIEWLSLTYGSNNDKNCTICLNGWVHFRNRTIPYQWQFRCKSSQVECESCKLRFGCKTGVAEINSDELAQKIYFCANPALVLHNWIKYT